MQELCRFIEAHCDEPLSLAALGQHAGLSPCYLQRTFKALTGLSPRQYAESCRLALLKAGLRGRSSVTEAIHDAGFGSSSRVYERVQTRLGMTPGQYRKDGRGVHISFATAPTPLGLLLMAATDRGLCSVQLGDNTRELTGRLQREFPCAALAPRQPGSDPQFKLWMKALLAYLDEEIQRPALPLDVHGTVFQIKVWHYLTRIPSGEVRTYAEVAGALGKPGAARAIANACASNRIAVLIPCHRVIRGDGGLGGYRWGIERKQALLERENPSGDAAAPEAC